MGADESANFAEWPADPARTREERFGAEVLIENAIGFWRQKHAIQFATNYEAVRMQQKERQLNPAYEPGFSQEDAERICEVLPTLETLSFSHFNDRPLRDVAFLRFCPALCSLTSYNNEVLDWSPLTALPQLRELRITDRQTEDLRPVGSLSGLQILHVMVDCPWLNLEGWGGLDALQELDFCGNILALSEVPRLASLRRAKIHHRGDGLLPLRSVADLPEMPELRQLYLQNTWRLDGIERYPRLVNATIYGMFRDLSPLAALTELTHLMVSGNAFDDLSPLAALSELCALTVRRELPQDYTPLTVLPRLHEITAELSPSSKLEVATLNASLVPWDTEFMGRSPRPLRPLRLRIEREHEAEPEPAESPRDWGDDREMSKSEGRWFAREISRRLGLLLGRGWGKMAMSFGNTGHEQVMITRAEDLDRLPQAVDVLRGLMASARHRWSVLLCVDPMRRYERGLADFEKDDNLENGERREQFNVEREREEWEDSQRRQRERQQFLERLHRYRLRQEQGLPVDPIEFAPPPEEKPEESAFASGDEADPEYDLGTEISLYAMLTETSLFIHESARGVAEMLLNVQAEEPPSGPSG